MAFAITCIGLFTACNFTEEMYLNTDGSGKMAINFDGAELLQMIGDEDLAPDEKAIDSTFHFKHLLEEKKDSIATLSPEKQAQLKRLENFSMHVLMNQEKGEMKFELFTNFKNLTAVGDMLSSFQDASAVQPDANEAKSASPRSVVNNNATKVDYSFKRNTFSRTTTILDEALLKETVDSLGMMESFFGGSNYQLKYHFPKKIKKVSKEDALFSQDGKTLILEVDFLEYIKNPKILDVTVELEK